MKKIQFPKLLRSALIFLFFIFFTALAGQPFPAGYFHLADPLVMMAAVALPLPYALIIAVLGCAAVDWIKGYFLLTFITVVAKILLVLAVKGLLKLPAAKQYPDLVAAPAALISIPLYYLGAAIDYFYNNLPNAPIGTALAYATRVLQKEAVQALLGMLLFILLYGIYKKIKQRHAAKQSKEQ